MRARARIGLFVGVGLALAVALAVVVAPRASTEPDGLERVALDHGFADRAEDHALAASPTADYGVAGVGHDGLAIGLAGVVGIAVTFAVVAGGLAVLRRASRRSA